MAQKKTTDNPSYENLSFEQAIDALQKIVNQIESGQTPLQAGIEQYEKGMALIRHCRGILQDAEQKIEAISREPNPDEK